MSTNARLRAVRGAITVREDTPAAISDATSELLRSLLERNGLAAGDLVSIIFTSTPDLVASFPAEAARALGLDDVPLLCAAEIAVPGALPRCIRVLVHTYGAEEPQHVYLRGAESLRSDLVSNPQHEV